MTVKIPRLAPLMFRANRHMDRVEIELPNGRKPMAWFLGRGKFSNVFELVGGFVIIYTKHGDLSKDILSHVDRRNNKHIPVMQYLGPMYEGSIDVYRSKHYMTPINKQVATKATWQTMMALRRAHAEACSKFTGDIIAKKQCVDFNYYIAENTPAPAKIREALRLITESAMEWGEHYLFDDFRAANLGTDKQGRLVFIDAMFNAELIQQQGE